MDLGIDPVAGLVDQLDRVSSVAVHEAPAIWDTSVAHEDHELMGRLRVLRGIIPEHGAIVGVGEVGRGVTLLGVDEVRELGGITEEEDGGVVGHVVPVALFRPELDGKASRITSTIVRAGFATDGGEADGDGALLALGAEHVCHAEIVQGLGACEDAMSPATFGVDNTLGDPLPIEVGDEVDQVKVLKEEGTIGTSPLSFIWMGHGHAIAGGVDGLLRLGISVFGV